MITLGLDPHPSTHTVVALDLNGSLLESLTVLNTTAGIAQLQHFASRFPLRRWAIEGAGNHFIVTFVKELLEHGEAVYSICPNLTRQFLQLPLLLGIVKRRQLGDAPVQVLIHHH